MTEPKPTQSDKLDTLATSVQSLTFDNERVIKPAIQEIKDLLHAMPNGFVSKEDVSNLEKDANITHVGFDKRIATLEKARSKSWLFNSASAGIGAILFWLVQYVLTHR